MEKAGAEATVAVGPRPEARVHTNNRELCSGQFVYHTTERSGSRGQGPPPIRVPTFLLQKWLPDGLALCCCQVLTGKYLARPPSLLSYIHRPLQWCLLSSLTTSFPSYVPHLTDLHLEPHTGATTDCPRHVQAASPAMPLNSLRQVGQHSVMLPAKYDRRKPWPWTLPPEKALLIQNSTGQEWPQESV